MTPSPAAQRVAAACEFRRPDRVPRYDCFWDYPPAWRERFGPEEALTDVAIWVPDEGTWPSRRRTVRRDGDTTICVDSWGQVLRTRDGAEFAEVLESPLQDAADFDAVRFDPPDLDARYLRGQPTPRATLENLAETRRTLCVFGKTGGPFLRSAFVRGHTRFLLDIAGDEPLARALAEKMADHLIGIAAEEIRRWSLQDSGVWIFDDMACNQGPMLSPRSFERVFLPAYRRMVRAYKAAGARYVFLHSDGDIRPLLEMLVEAGIDGLHPLERRAGMDPAALRAKFPRLILAGGMDNSQTLVEGPVERIRAEAREMLQLGRDGGVMIGAHSIGPDIPPEHFQAYHRACLEGP